ncbi:unnamed protein product, partial [Prorocentrum cordatum]
MPAAPGHAGGAVSDRAQLPGASASGGVQHRALRPSQPVKLETFSIVLPCAYEGQNAVRTVESIWKHTKPSRIKEFILVDDGSVPPLETELPYDLLHGKRVGAPVVILRQPKTLGLIAAKKRGGDAAKGDVIVFLDCHVAPNDGWDEAFLRQMSRAALPMITALDPDTWTEKASGPRSYACYVLWNGDFTWLSNAGRDVPLMSGGLLALSRRWWEETGGLDDRMIAWGGENIDQSIRAWLCGGRIELAENASIAHMWRDSKNPKTTRKFPMPTEDVMRNKARAVAAWFDEFKEKTFSFPEYEDIISGKNPMGDMGHFDRLKKTLTCKPFTLGLRVHRFDYVYIHSGLIPEEVFQLREQSTGLCLERTVSAEMHHGGLVLAPCAAGSELQLWHPANRDRSRARGPCCSGIANWNFILCVNSPGLGAPASVFECDISGGSGLSNTQEFRLRDGQIEFQGGKGCLSPAALTLARAVASIPGTCRVRVSELDLQPGGSKGSFRLVTTERAPLPLQSACAAATSSADKASSELTLGFQKCEGAEPEQTFHVKKMHGGFQVQVGESGKCLDAAGGNGLLVYHCYEESVGNKNQIWHLDGGELVWRGSGESHCVDVDLSTIQDAQQDEGIKLETCASKDGQLFSIDRGGSRQNTFHIRDADRNSCLVRSSSTKHLDMGGCSEDQRWREMGDTRQIQHVSSGHCLDAGDESAPILYPCHTPTAGRKQRFRTRDSSNYMMVQMEKGWEDNGRKIYPTSRSASTSSLGDPPSWPCAGAPPSADAACSSRRSARGCPRRRCCGSAPR